LVKSCQIAAVNQAEKIAGSSSTDGNGRFDPVQRLDEALMIAEFALSSMASVPADKPGMGAAWGRTRHPRHTSCRSRARRGRTIPRHRAAASGCVKPGMPFISTPQQSYGVDDHAPLLRTVTQCA
jgi:hypothetical protein